MQNKLTQSPESILVEKKSFYLFKDTLKILNRLSDEQAGKLFKAINDYNNGTQPILDETLSLVFFPFENQFIRDAEKYIEQSIINKENGTKGGRPKKETEITEPVIQKPKKADTDTDKVIDTEKESESDTTAHSQFLSFTNYKTNYTDLPEPIQTIITKEDWNTWQLFNSHLDSKCKNIRKMQEQMNFSDYLEYKTRYIKSKLISAERFKLMLSKFNNYQPNQKLSSVYDALIDWSEREIAYMKVA